jgi:hypothetical protein
MTRAHGLKLDDDRIAKLFGDGLNAIMIGKRLGASTEVIRKRLMKMFGTTAPAKPYCADMITLPEVVGNGSYQHKPAFIEHYNGSGAV